MKKNQYEKDKKRRLLFEKYEVKRVGLLSLRNNLDLDDDIRYKAQLYLSSLPLNSSKSRIKNRCIETKRSKSVYRDFGFSRIVLRDLCGKRFLPGIRKSSW